ncbi:MAG: pyridoxal-phosphate dependent enzyme [Paraburkholderia sp.]|uniref:pyridoxal-phosphate dependent enzyme n=1 Tax=Paraburkholderia sp. TaxID=1926495 RepID=UPI00120055B4|nr:pyridoxal-phosphate dependent enzyme [Paraburkholderia sp.]TAL94324.1 MAG: pyridoxal-phosphate dependent enzyme [Paraburkholderia sp.]
MPLHIQTPLLTSRPLGLAAGATVLLKLDAMQPPGSFKIRGIGYACEAHARQGKQRFISSSGGNAGVAVAYAARQLGLPAVVVVPQTTTQRAKDLIAMEGAEVIVHGATWQEANGMALSLVGATDAFIHPFDDPLLWTGHATIIDEVVAAGEQPDAVVLSVGGGGLLCGVHEGLRRNNLGHVPIIAVETEGADSFAQSVKAGKRIELDAIRSVATSLGAKQVSEQAFKLAQSADIRPFTVTDAAAIMACKRFLDDHRVLVEPACGASLAPVYDHASVLEGFRKILVIVCGGAGVTVGQLEQYLAAT